MNQLKLTFALIYKNIVYHFYFFPFAFLHLEGLAKKLKMDKILKWIIHSFHFLLSNHKSSILKLRCETSSIWYFCSLTYIWVNFLNRYNLGDQMYDFGGRKTSIARPFIRKDLWNQRPFKRALKCKFKNAKKSWK